MERGTAEQSFNGYVYYINRNHVVDAKPFKQYLDRYANDTNGIARLNGIRNNCSYTISSKKVFIKAIKNISADEEIHVSYGKEYWDIVRYNNRPGKQSQKRFNFNQQTG